MPEPGRNSRGQVAAFSPITGRRAFEEVIDQVTYAIRAGHYRPGQRLPSIEQLSAALGVSKPTVVEAIKLLTKARVLSTKQGAKGGITVLSTDIPPTLLGMSRDRRATLSDLLEARRAIEMRLALLCGERATQRDFKRLAEAVGLLKEADGDDEASSLYTDQLFHYAMGRAARSELLSMYQHDVMEQLAIYVHGNPESWEDVKAGIRIHERTLEALMSRDPRRITRVMDEHLAGAERRFFAARKR
jgi:GntR family transcriptional regulator, transcriptional repressor for pyruvate dehydrogenase complex